MRIGLISDTHMPRRWKTLPLIVSDVFGTCDIILHAGDVGELWVLDQLSRSAPVIAVHGNDETDEATAALPFLQTLVCETHRIVLTHSHYPDRKTEMEQRKDDSWYPKLQYRADFGKAHGASIVVSGHTHGPMQVEFDGVMLINPGAIASGNGWTKQVLQTIAVMTLTRDALPQVEFIHVQTGDSYYPNVNLEAGFQAQSQKTYEFIISEDLSAVHGWFMEAVYPLNPRYFEAMILPLCHAVWAGEREKVTLKDAIQALTETDHAPADVIEVLRKNETVAPYMRAGF
jgi:putative phosphoesterase